MATTKCNKTKYNIKDHFNDLMNFITNSKYYQRYNGTDHLYIHSAASGKYANNVGPNGIANFCEKCFKTCYWHQPGSHETWVSVPFPSMFHYHDDIKYIPWNANRSHERRILATFIGSIRRGNGKHIRSEIAAVCENSVDCKIISYGLKEANDLTNSDINSFSNHTKRQAPEVMGYYDSVFCFCPPGDDPTRRGLIDSIVAGCIPVTFNPNTLLNQMPLHLSMREARSIGVYIPLKSFMKKRNLMEILRNISSGVVREKQLLIEKIAPRLQYSVPPRQYLKDHNDETPWDPPFKDAVNALLDSTIKLNSKRLNNVYNEVKVKSIFPDHPTLKVDLFQNTKTFSKNYDYTICAGAQVLL